MGGSRDGCRAPAHSGRGRERGVGSGRARPEGEPSQAELLARARRPDSRLFVEGEPLPVAGAVAAFATQQGAGGTRARERTRRSRDLDFDPRGGRRVASKGLARSLLRPGALVAGCDGPAARLDGSARRRCVAARLDPRTRHARASHARVRRASGRSRAEQFPVACESSTAPAGDRLRANARRATCFRARAGVRAGEARASLRRIAGEWADAIPAGLRERRSRRGTPMVARDRVLRPASDAARRRTLAAHRDALGATLRRDRVRERGCPLARLLAPWRTDRRASGATRSRPQRRASAGRSHGRSLSDRRFDRSRCRSCLGPRAIFLPAPADDRTARPAPFVWSHGPRAGGSGRSRDAQ